MTEKLYYKDSKIFDFSAKCINCTPIGNHYGCELDRTAFFPEGGGQAADTGFISDVQVIDVQEINGRIIHFTEFPILSKEILSCFIDKEQRLRRMQNHSGEHVVSGLIHKLYGFDNKGFHMGSEFMTLDYNGELSKSEIKKIEILANNAIRDNITISTLFPSEEELIGLNFRSKLELSENIRIVIIDGIDVCACCAPHMNTTGEIGLIKILDSNKHRGGTRLTCVAGMDAFELICKEHNTITEISKLLSAPKSEVTEYVLQKIYEVNQYKNKIASLNLELINVIDSSIIATDKNICIFREEMDEISHRELVNLLSEKTTKIASVFCGDDENGYRYIIGSKSVNLKELTKEINETISGKGGGRPEMISGHASAHKKIIEDYFQNNNWQG